MLDWLLKSPTVRAYALALARHVATSGGAIMAAWLIKHGIANADAASLAEGLGALIVPIVSIGFSMLDVRKVDTQVKSTQAATAGAVARGIQSGSVSAPAIASQASAALAQGDGASKQLAQTIAALKAGQA